MRLNLQLDRVSVRDAMNHVLEMTNLTYTIQDGVVIVIPKEWT